MWLRRLAVVGAGIAGALVITVGAGVVLHPSVQVAVEPAPEVPLDRDALARVLADVITVPTVSREGAPPDAAAFADLRARLEQHFPGVHATLEREQLGETLIYTWAGSNPALPAGVLMAHQDVVPADGQGWTAPPFEGRVADGFVWGRGALDDKNNLVAQLWAVEVLIARGFRPARTVHLVFGHDEEIGGTGARDAAAALAARGRIGWVVDEGGPLLHEAIDGLAPPAALIGVAEKGYATVELVAEAAGGHSSMPPASTAAGRLARAVVALEASPMRARLTPPVGAMFDALGPEMEGPLRLVMANRWLLGPVLLRVLQREPSTNATVRTTAAVTMLSGSDKENVLPQRAVAAVNFRILPGDSVEAVLEHVRSVVGPAIEVRVRPGFHPSEPSPVSRADGPGWDALATTIRESFPDVVVAPFLMVGATDARWFAPHCDEVYRFSPVRMTHADLGRLHGDDERISVDALGGAAAFYVRFLERAAGG